MSARQSSLFASFGRLLHFLPLLFRSQRWLLALGALVLLLANSLLTYLSVQSLYAHEQQVTHAQAVLTTIQQVQTTLDEAETGQRGFLLTNDPSYLTPYQTARTQIDEQIKSLHTLVADTLTQQHYLATLQPLLQQKLEELQQTVDLAQAHQTELALQIVRSGTGEQLMDQIRQVLSAMRQTEQGTLQQQTASVQNSVSIIVGTFTLAALIDVLLLGGTFLLWQRETRRRTQVEALNQVGTALSAELNKPRLLSLIAQAARDLTGAAFAAFTLRPTDGQSTRFHLAGAAGLTPEQEAVLQRIPLGGEGVLAPVYQERRLVRVADVPADGRAIGTPKGHPLVRSFLGAPLVGRDDTLLGGLLLGHGQPKRFRLEHERLLANLAAEATVALENAQLYEQMQRRAEELEAVLESMVNGVALHKKNGEVIRLNRAARALETATGVAIGQLLVDNLPGVTVSTLSGEPILPEQRPTRRALAGETIRSADLLVSWAPGQERELNVTASPLHGTAEGAAGVVTVVRDVTIQRQQERTARRYEEAEAQRHLLQTLLEELPNGVCLLEGEERRLVLANQAAEAVWGMSWPTGLSVQEFSRAAGLRVSQPDGRPLSEEKQPGLRALLQKERIRAEQYFVRQPNGVTLPLLVSAVRLPSTVLSVPGSSTGETTHPLVAVVMQDISALKEAERLKDEFVALVSHELKNPLTSIKGYVQLLRLQLENTHAEPLSPQEKLGLQVIEEEVDRLSGLASDVIDVARLQSGRLALRLDDVELVALLRRVAERQQITTTAHSITVNTIEENLWLRADRSRLEQVMVNLVSNAIKYSPAGGSVEIRLTQSGDGQVQVIVCDQGIGIPHDQQGKLFGRFVRATNAAAQGISGTGLGLFLCRELIERHGGQIWVESVEGQGTTIFFLLPLDGPAEDVS